MRLQSQAIAVAQFHQHCRVGCDVALVRYESCEQEQLHLGQLLADAPPLAQGEEEHVAGQVFIQHSALVQEALWVKDIWLGPIAWVMVDGPLVDEDDCVLWYGVAHDGCVCGGGVGDGERDETCEAHHLVDEGHDIRQLLLVLDSRDTAPVHHFVHLLLETHLYLWIPAIIGEHTFKVTTARIEVKHSCW